MTTSNNMIQYVDEIGFGAKVKFKKRYYTT